MDEPTVPVIVHSELQTPKEDHGLTMQGRGLRRVCSKKTGYRAAGFCRGIQHF